MGQFGVPGELRAAHYAALHRSRANDLHTYVTLNLTSNGNTMMTAAHVEILYCEYSPGEHLPAVCKML